MSWEDYGQLSTGSRRSGQRVAEAIKVRIRELRKQGLTYAQIHRRLGVSPVTIRNAIKGEQNENK